jgi:hypothetical protein
VGATDAGVMQVGPKKERIEAIVTEYRTARCSRRHTRGMEMTDRLAVVLTADGSKVAWSVSTRRPWGLWAR